MAKIRKLIYNLNILISITYSYGKNIKKDFLKLPTCLYLKYRQTDLLKICLAQNSNISALLLTFKKFQLHGKIKKQKIKILLGAKP